MSDTYIDLHTGISHTTGMHIGQDMRKIKLVFDEQTVNLDTIVRPVSYKATREYIELTGVIYHFPTLNNFLQKYNDKLCTIDTEIYEVVDKSTYPYTSFPMKLVDYKIAYFECSRSEAKLIFKRV